MVIFESMPAFLSIYIPLALLGFVAILKEDRLIEWETRLGKKMRAFFRQVRYGKE